MDSGTLEAQGFGHWMPFTKGVHALAPEKKGAYALRIAKPLPLLNGQSDVVYIGKAANYQGLRMRMRQYWHPGHLQTTNLRIQELARRQTLEVAWVLTDDPEALESSLLWQYESDHGQLPPMNRRR